MALPLRRLSTIHAKCHKNEGVVIEKREADPGEHLGLARDRVVVPAPMVPLVLRLHLLDLHGAIDDEHDGRDEEKEVDAFSATATLISHIKSAI